MAGIGCVIRMTRDGTNSPLDCKVLAPSATNGLRQQASNSSDVVWKCNT